MDARTTRPAVGILGELMEEDPAPLRCVGKDVQMLSSWKRTSSDPKNMIAKFVCEMGRIRLLGGLLLVAAVGDRGYSWWRKRRLGIKATPGVKLLFLMRITVDGGDYLS